MMVGLIFTMAFNIDTNGQSIASSEKLKTNLPSFSNSEETSRTNPNLLSRDDIPFKAIKDFKKNYKVNNENWVKIKDGYISSFKSDKGYTRVYYNRKGQWTFLLKTYEEKDLKKDIRTIVKRKYFDYKIVFVHEIMQNDDKIEPVYLVLIKLENDNKWIRLNSEGMAVYQQFTTTD